MLVIRELPHKMGSTQPESDPFLPFGYAVDPNQEPLFDAPEPAPGAPLLSETDNKFLTSFFEDINADQYNMPSFGEGLNFSDAWLEMPPALMGTSTSYGQQEGTTPLASPNAPDAAQSHPTQSSRTTSTAQMMPPPVPQPHSQQQQYPSEDVLSAAATLLQNGSAARTGSNNNDSLVSRRPPPVGHLRHQPLEEFRQEGRKGSEGDQNEHIFADWFSAPPNRPVTRNPTQPPADFQWGSDSTFNSVHNYKPMSRKDTFESLQQEQLKCLDCLEVNKSTNTTRQNSPVNGHSTNHNHGPINMPKRPDDVGAPPRKRRKSKNVKDPIKTEVDEVTMTPKSAKQRKKSEHVNVEVSPSEDGAAAGKRRKSAVNIPKGQRENLSEEQKRENHIKSEQRRRTLIKEGFDDLCELVPGLRGGGFSKSTMLTMAAEWLEDMLQGNEILAKQLASLGK